MGNENAILESEERQADSCQSDFCREEKAELRRQLAARERTIDTLVYERDLLKQELGIIKVGFGPMC